MSQKNNTDVAHYNFNAHQPILIIFGRDTAKEYSIERSFILSASASRVGHYGAIQMLYYYYYYYLIFRLT